MIANKRVASVNLLLSIMNKISLEDCIKNKSNASNAKQIQMTTGSSLPFKSTARQNKASWGNRIIKDFNDLTYDVPIDIIQQNTSKPSGLSQFKRSPTIDIRSTRQKSRSPQSRYKNIDKKYLTKNDYTTPNKIRFQRIKIGNDSQFQALDTSGLCQFQYKNLTIHGSLKKKSNHHLAFENQTCRKANNYKVWYNPELTYGHQFAKKRKQRKVRQNLHSFDSYTDRRVFEPKETIDHFYKTEQLWRKTSPVRIKETVQFEKITGRKQQIERLASSLQMKYDTIKGEQTIRQRPCSFGIVKGFRQLNISRQVINSQRGCFR